MMLDNNAIIRLYASVLHEDILKYKVNREDIRVGIGNMKEVYLPNPTSLTSGAVDVANYNDVAHRCAYLHKYAPLHTIMVYDMLNRALKENISVFQNILTNGCLKLCSLGGGPGSDVLGVLAAMHENFGFYQSSVTIVDFMVNWSVTFSSIVEELRFGRYGTLGESFNPQYFNWSYIGANLLGVMSEQVHQAIASAEIITMIKFVSAAACKDTFQMIKKIFNSMKPGAIVLYIDNAGGGFHQLVRRGAAECRFITIFGPLKHEHYVNESVNIKRFGYTSCFETKISVHIWQKPKQNQNSHKFINHLSHDQNEQNSNRRRSRSRNRNSYVTNHRSQSASNVRRNYTVSSDNDNFQIPYSKLPTSPANMNRNVPNFSRTESAANITRSNYWIQPEQNISSVIVQQPRTASPQPTSADNDVDDICCSCCAIS